MSNSSQNLLSSFQKAATSPEYCKGLLDRLENVLSGKTMRFMEVCGTHTTAIFQSGLSSILPKNVIHLSGPGCPVCVTHDREIALFLELANNPAITIATFGDLMRVPDVNGFSLKNAQAMGADIRIVYSPLQALDLARLEPGREIVFLGAGFETTAPLTAAAILQARELKVANFSVFSMHKLIPPALKMLLSDPEHNMDAFLLPGHVATITGLAPFQFLASNYNMPGAIGGFEPVDILLALVELAKMLVMKKPDVVNAYQRAVNNNGNSKATFLLQEIFNPVDAKWRGLDNIPASGLQINKKYADFDALHKYSLQYPEINKKTACKCGLVLKGQLSPKKCPLFAQRCTPANPVGPCMVSTEGSCAAMFKYGI